MNEFDKDAVTEGYYIASDGTETANNSWCISNYMEVSKVISYQGLTQTGTAPYSAWYDSNKNFISSFKQAYHGTKDVPSNAKYVRFSVNISSSYNDLNTFKVEEGSVETPYTPYGMGCVTEKIVNKNIYDNINYPLIANRAINTSTGTVYSSSSGNYYATEAYIPFDYAEKTISKTNTLELVYYNSNKEYVGALVNQNTGVVPANTKYVRFDITTANKDIAQIEFSNTPTPYTKHQEQNFIIPTQQPMRSIETTRDFFFKNTVDSPYYDSNLTLNAWYERHNIGEKILDGTEDWSDIGGNAPYRITISNSLMTTDNNQPPNLLINSFQKASYNATWSNYSNLVVPDEKYYSKRLMFRYTAVANLTEWKAFLAEKYSQGEPIKFIYLLEIPTDLLCTPEQVTALEVYIKARTYKNQTHIYSKDITPAYQNVVYYKDTVGYLNSLEARIEALEGGN